MDATIFNEDEITKTLVNVVNELYPFYDEIKPFASVYSKDKYLNLEKEYVRVSVNNDNFGKIFIVDNKLIASYQGFGVGVSSEVNSIEEGIRFLVSKYFRIR